MIDRESAPPRGVAKKWAAAVVLSGLLASGAWSQASVEAIQPAPPAGSRHDAARNMELDVRDRSFGVCSLDGKTYGVGPGYRVEFGEEGFELVPALGPKAQQGYSLRFRLESVGRRDRAGVLVEQLVWPATPGPQIQGNLVSYEHGDVLETYEARVSGIEQSFTLRALPEGRGDLVVRGRIETDLPLAVDREDELRFELAGIGGVRIGAVTGIDAHGARAPGALRYDAGVLELVLPEAFVARAAFPLIVDPLIGGIFTPGGGSNVTSADVAFDASNDVYLVAWSEVAASSTVLAQRVSSSGTLVGGPILVQAATTSASSVGVANISGAVTFVVVYKTAGDIVARAVEAATASVSPPLLIDSDIWPTVVTPTDVAGDARPTGDAALVAYHSGPTSLVTLRVQQLNTATGRLSLGGRRSVRGVASFSSSKISKSGGSAGRWLVWSWNYYRGWCVVLDSHLTSGSMKPVDQSPSVEIDGDGTNWTLAYATATSIGRSDVACSTLTYAATSSGLGSVTVGPEVLIEADPNELEMPSAVAWAGGSALVAFADNGATHVRSIDDQSCLDCEGEFVVDPAGSFGCAMASQKSGDPAAGDGVLIVWIAAGNLQARLFRADDGDVTDLGGGCGQGGTAYASCARVGNAGFTPRLRGAAAAAPLWLALGVGTIQVPCGPCTLVPDVAAGLIAGAGTTDAQGSGSFAIPIPPDPTLSGATFHCQWIVATAQASCEFGVDLSNALQVLIQQ